MTEINLYSIPEANFPRLFAKLIEAIVSKDNRILLCSESDQEIAEFDKLLWTYAQLSFLPHATYKDPPVEGNVVYLTNTLADNQNNANFAIIMGEYIDPSLHHFDKYLYFYNSSRLDYAKRLLMSITAADMPYTCIHYTEQKWIKNNALTTY